MAVISDEDVEQRLSQGSMVERIGSFLPPFRPGYGLSKHEIRLQKSVARKLYNKRIKVARVMSAPHGKDSAALVTTPSLVSAGISPHSIQKYDEYIELLSQRQGGWKRWKKHVASELETYDKARKEIIKQIGIIIAILAISLIVGAIGNTFFFNVEYFFIIPTVITFCAIVYASLFGYKKVKANKAIIEKSVGSKKKKVDDFFPYSKL